MAKLTEFRDENTGRFMAKNNPLMVPIAAKVTEEERSKIADEAAKLHLSISEYVRFAVSWYINRATL